MFKGANVAWCSRTQRCVTLSSSKAEYVALGEVAKEVLFVKQVLAFMYLEMMCRRIVIYEDNQGAIDLANPLSSGRT